MTESQAKVRVAVIDDHPVVLEGIQSWIRTDDARRVEVIAVGGSIDEVLDGPGGSCDVVLLDLNLGDGPVIDRIEGLTATGRRIVVFSQSSDPDTILKVLDAGACAYLAKHEGRDHCVETLVAVAADRPYVTPSVAGAMVTDQRPASPRLSGQEQEALRLWFQGMSKASVARRMSIQENTVKQYIDRARMKYIKAGRAAPTTFALLARAIEDGLIDSREVGEYRSFAAAPERAGRDEIDA
ncbi:response regulator [Rugosimonospora africana]|uniref:DNA-binding response regulator n=1 Tax=Rugosimonospora africana TaxID=556532 RepID=A0A8J3QX23_9ACTN|nr:response regulator transcription factor [Rugosimonospora africana]GIH16296.1 DNA-binding response regulator [Rugosimonospora africana]